MTKHSWEVMNIVWPALVQAQHSEKPSILKLVDDIMDNLHKNIEAADLKLKVSEIIIIVQWNPTVTLLSHCGLVTPYGDIDLGQHWLR